jgi:hypothetical protein
MKKYLWAALFLTFLLSGESGLYELMTTGHIKKTMGNIGTPFIMDFAGSILMIGMGILGLKAFWKDITQKEDDNGDT